jgi:prevent-host-death family protein
MKKTAVRDTKKRGAGVAELKRGKKLTAAEVFGERERSGYFKKFPKTNGELSRFISEDRNPQSIRGISGMKKASIRDLHMRTGALVQEAADGKVIIIEKRGVPVAQLEPLRKLTAAEAFRELEQSGYFARMGKTNSNIDRLISEDRDR